LFDKVAVAAFPEMFIPQVPVAPVPEVVGAPIAAGVIVALPAFDKTPLLLTVKVPTWFDEPYEPGVTVVFESIAFVMSPFAILVAFPTLVTTPVRFALVVTLDAKVAVAAFPDMLTPQVPVAPVPVVVGAPIAAGVIVSLDALDRIPLLLTVKVPT
jgi:hypothetical protein